MSKFLVQNKSKICYSLAFLLPVFLMLVLSFIFGFYPFGRLSVLVADLRYQFVDYYGYLKRIFFDNDTYLYTFSKTFGGDMAGFAAYYLNNPFVFLLLLFPNDALPAGVLFMIILLIGFSGFNFNLFINKVYGTRWASIIFSTAYAMMGFFMAYIGFTIYFFNIMMLPLVILGLYQSIESGKRSYLYIAALFLSVFSNYYVGYMTCIFTLLFFVYEILLKKVNHSFKNEKEEIKKGIINYIVSSILAVALSAFSLFAVMFSLQGQKSSGISVSKLVNFNILDVFSGLYSTSFNGNISDGLPIIYCSVIAIVFLLLYFMNRKIVFLEKIISGVILIIFLISFWSDFLNVMWHGFSHPIGFPYRNSFMFSFLLLFIAYKGFINMRQSKLRHIVICMAIFTVYSLYLLLTDNAYVLRPQVIITGTIFVITLAGVFLFNYRREYAIPVIFCFFLIQIGDLLVNGYVSISRYFPELISDNGLYSTENQEAFESYSIENYANFVDETTAIVADIKSRDDSFYRLDKLYRRTHNDAMLIGYNGLSHFSSCETNQVKNFMGSLGFRNNGNWAFYGDGSTSFADSLLGLKYLLSQYDETAKPYNRISSYNNKYVYQNPYALGLAFGTKASIKDITFNDEKHFEYQNEIASSFTDKKYNIYKPVQIETIKLYNVEENQKIYSKIEKGKEAYIEYQFTAENEDFIYMYFNAPKVQDTTIVINGLEKPSYFSIYGWSIREVGHYMPGERVNIRLYLNQDSIEVSNYEFYYEDKEMLANWYSDAAKTVSSINKVSSSHLKGTIDAAEGTEMLVFSIPYESNWVIKIDDIKVQTEDVLNGLLAARITAGTHKVELQYVPIGLVIGTSISLIAFIVLIGIILIDKRKRK